MRETELFNIIEKADEEYRYICNIELSEKEKTSQLTLHKIALIVLFEHFLHEKLRVKEVLRALQAMPEEMGLYHIMIRPYLSITNDTELIVRRYGSVYLRYLSEKGQGKSEDEIMLSIFTGCSDVQY